MQENKKCVLCNNLAQYLSRYGNEPLCGKHTQEDEQINWQHGYIDKYGNETEKGKQKRLQLEK